MTDYPGAGQPAQWPDPQRPPWQPPGQPAGPGPNQPPPGPPGGPAGGPPPGGPPPPYGPPPAGYPQGGPGAYPPGPGGPPGPGAPPGPGGPFPPGPGGPGGFPPGPGGPGGPGGFPPGPGGFGPYGPNPQRSKTPWILAGTGVVVAAAIVVALVLVMGGGGSSSGAKGALEKLLNAAQNRDIKTAQSLTCPPLSDQLMSPQFAQVVQADYKVGDADENGDSATVPFTETLNGDDANFQASAQKVDGAWKICDVKQGGPGAQGGGDGGGGAAGATTAPAQGAPEQTVQRLLQAGKDRDLPTAQALTCEPLHSHVKDFPEISSFEVSSGSVDGSSAQVPFTVDDNDGTHHEVAELEQQGGTWKVCDFHEGSSSGSGSQTSGLPSSPPDFPTDLPTGGGTGSFCVTPNGSTPICIPDN